MNSCISLESLPNDILYLATKLYNARPRNWKSKWNTTENRNGHCAFVLSGADINNGPLPAQSTFIAQIFIELFENSGPKTKQKNGIV